MSNAAATAETATVHAWELAGLGKAPYRYVGYERLVFQAVPGDPSCPIQAGGSCDYCANAIMNAYYFRSADGVEFKVGCDCFYRANAKGTKLAKQVDAAVARHEKAVAEARKARKVAANVDAFSGLLDRLATWSDDGGFRGEFAVSLAKQIRKGKKPSDKQLALVERLAAE
jgi:radical SAM superfamily enzyme with C-terminal helix-hairpin-helix motif